MSLVEFVGVRIDAVDVRLVAAFWAGVLAGTATAGLDATTTVIPGGGGYPLIVTPADTPKHGQNRIHLDVTSASDDALRDTVARALELDGSHVDIGQGADANHVVLADPEGNELCVIEPGNAFLADTGAVGAINCDGSRALGQFWSEALGWPLVWDSNEETAVQSPDGGSKITWSGPPLMPRRGRDRLRLVVMATGLMTSVIEGLTELGATAPDGAGPAETTLLDPDGNEFHVVPAP